MRLRATIAALLAFATGASGYYHFIHYSSRNGPFLAMPEKWDLAALPDKTVRFFISDLGPAQLGANDSFTGVVTQLRAAAKVWNNVETSELRLAFGGFTPPDAPQSSSPGIDVLFDEMAPGIIAFGGPTRKGDLTGSAAGPFVPIQRAVVVFNKDLTTRPSYSDAFFLTAVHEFGHALGLQHSLTSATMSTEITRATSKARPLAADDIAGLSLLYPASSYRSTTGSISGRVSAEGVGVALASVVAIAANGPAISTLTHPDGTYRIDGLPAGSYYVYAHPLPPALQGELSPANITAPVDASGQPFPFGPSFETQFYPGTKDWRLAAQVPVSAGQTVEAVNFNVQRNTRPAIYAVQTYSYPGNYSVKPAYVNFNGGRPLLAVTGVGLVSNGAPAPGLSVSVLGGASSIAPTSPRPFTSDYILLDLIQPPGSIDGPRHLVFSLNNDIYVLPQGFTAVQAPPPAIASVTPVLDGSGRAVLLASGTGLTPDTRILFDGLPATLVGGTAQGLLVIPPPAPVGYRAVVTAINPDGQTSMFVQAQAPVTFTYDSVFGSGDPPPISVNPNAFTPGTESFLEITAAGPVFVDGATFVGSATSDLVIRRAWVVSPNRILANVIVAADAAAGTVPVEVMVGFRSVQTAPVQIQSPGVRRAYISAQFQNLSVPGSASVFPGNTLLFNVPNLTPAQAASLSASIGDLRLTPIATPTGQIQVTLPVLPPGPAILRFQTGVDAMGIVIPIDPMPPSIVGLSLGSSPVDSVRGLRAGDVVTAVVSDLAEAGAAIPPPRVHVSLGGIEQLVFMVSPIPGAALHQVQFVVGNVAPGSYTLTVSNDARTSLPYPVVIR